MSARQKRGVLWHVGPMTRLHVMLDTVCSVKAIACSALTMLPISLGSDIEGDIANKARVYYYVSQLLC